MSEFKESNNNELSGFFGYFHIYNNDFRDGFSFITRADFLKSLLGPIGGQPSTSSSSHASRKHRQDWGKEIVDLEKKLALFQEKKKEIKDDNDDLNFFLSLIPMVRDFTALQKVKYRRRILEFTEDFLSEDVTILNLDDLGK